MSNPTLSRLVYALPCLFFESRQCVEFAETTTLDTAQAKLQHAVMEFLAELPLRSNFHATVAVAPLPLFPNENPATEASYAVTVRLMAEGDTRYELSGFPVDIVIEGDRIICSVAGLSAVEGKLDRGVGTH